MRKLLFAAVIAVMGAFVFAAGTPAQASPAVTMSEIGKAAPQSDITKAHCCRHHHHYYYRYRYYRPRYYYRRYYYRRCYYYYGYRRCYRYY